MLRPQFLLLSLSTAVAPLGCESPTSIDDRLAVSLSISTDSVRVAQLVHIRVAAVNRHTRPITVNAKGCPYAFTVADDSGVEIGPEGVMCTANLEVRELAFGDSLVFDYRWVPRRGAALTESPLLPPGAYQLRARVGADGKLVRSHPVTLNVIP